MGLLRSGVLLVCESKKPSLRATPERLRRRALRHDAHPEGVSYIHQAFAESSCSSDASWAIAEESPQVPRGLSESDVS